MQDGAMRGSFAAERHRLLELGVVAERQIRYLNWPALADGYRVLLGLLGDALAQPRARRLHLGDGVLIFECVNGRDTSRHRNGLVPERPGGEDLLDAVSEAVAAERRAERVSVGDRLAPGAEVRLYAERFPAAAVVQPESCPHLVHDQRRPDLIAQGPDALGELRVDEFLVVARVVPERRNINGSDVLGLRLS